MPGSVITPEANSETIFLQLPNHHSLFHKSSTTGLQDHGDTGRFPWAGNIILKDRLTMKEDGTSIVLQDLA